MSLLAVWLTTLGVAVASAVIPVINIDFDDVKQRTNAAGDTVIEFEGFTGPDAPKIVLDGVGFLEASDFIF